MRPREALRLHGPCERIVTRSAAAAYHPGGPVDFTTPLARTELGIMPDFPPFEMPDVEVTDTCEEEVVWGGRFGVHFGHFLVESAARLWPLLPGGPLAGRRAVFARHPRPPLPSTVEWLDAFGLRTVELPGQGAVRFTRMFVPEPGWRLMAWIAPEIRDVHLHARRNMSLPASVAHDVLWLSRSKLGANRLAYDECLLEWILGERVTVIHPQELSLAEQITALEGSRAVAGVTGSAFHALLLTERTPAALYLCPPWIPSTFPAQHRLFESEATFATRTLEVAASWRRARCSLLFPGAYRVIIPNALKALDDTVLPTLLEDPRMAAFAQPEDNWEKGSRSPADDLDAAVARVLLEPASPAARTDLGELFESKNLDRCAQEQFTAAADLIEER